MTGLFSRITSLVTGKANDVVDALEDPGSVARQTVREISDDIATAEKARVTIQTEYNNLEYKRDEAQKKVDEYAGYANSAVEQGDDALALSALDDQAKFEAKVADFQKQMDGFKPTIENLVSKINDLKKRRDEMQSQTSAIEARSAVAEARKTVANTITGLGDGKAASATFDRMEEKVRSQEAEAAALEEIANENRPDAGDDKYAKLKTAGTESAAERLAKLKAAAGK